MVVQPVRAVAVALLDVAIRRLPPRRHAVLSLVPLINLQQERVKYFYQSSACIPTCTIFLILTAGMEIPYLEYTKSDILVSHFIFCIWALTRTFRP